MMGLANTKRHVNYNHPSIGLVDNSEEYNHPKTSNNIYQRSPIYSSPGTKPTRGLRDGAAAWVMVDALALEAGGLGRSACLIIKLMATGVSSPQSLDCT